MNNRTDEIYWKHFVVGKENVFEEPIETLNVFVVEWLYSKGFKMTWKQWIYWEVLQFLLYLLN